MHPVAVKNRALIQQLYPSTINEIMAKTGLGRTTVGRHLKALNLKLRHDFVIYEPEKTELIKLWLAGTSIEDLSKKFNKSCKMIRRLIANRRRPCQVCGRTIRRRPYLLKYLVCAKCAKVKRQQYVSNYHKYFRESHPEKCREYNKDFILRNKVTIWNFYKQNACGHTNSTSLDHVHEYPHPKCGLLHGQRLGSRGSTTMYYFVASVIKAHPKPLYRCGLKWTVKDFQLLCIGCNTRKARAHRKMLDEQAK